MIDTERLNLLFSTAAGMGLNPKVVTDNGLLSIEIKGIERYLFHKVSNPNDQMASWLSENKYVARLIFERNNLPNIPFCVTDSLEIAKKFLHEHTKIVAKPIKGKRSQDIHLISNDDQLPGDKEDLGGYILEKFIKGQETRFLVADGAVKAVHLKVHSGEINDPKTVKRISLDGKDWDSKLVNLAIKAAGAIGLTFTAVDFLVTDDKESFLLEINSAPGLEKFQHPDQGPAIDAMRLYLEQVVRNYNTN